MSLYYLDDPSLSWEAKGLLAFYLREVSHIEVTIGDIHTDSPNGRKKTDRIVKELKKNNYCQSDHYQDDDGRWHWETFLYAYRQEE